MGIIKDFLKKIFGNRYIVKCKNFKLDCENNGTDVIKNENTSTSSEKIEKYKKLSPSEKVEYDKNELFISYKEDKKLEEICCDYLKKTYVLNLSNLELGFTPFCYEEWKPGNPEKIYHKYSYHRDFGLYSLYAQQVNNDIIKDKDYEIKEVIAGFYDTYILGHSIGNKLKEVKEFFDALNQQGILDDNSYKAYPVFIFYLYYLTRKRIKEVLFSKLDFDKVQDKYDLIYYIINSYNGDIFKVATVICVIEDNNKLISLFELKNRDTFRKLMDFHKKEEKLKELGLKTNITDEYKGLVDSLKLIELESITEKIKNEIEREEILKREEIEKAYKKEYDRIAGQLKLGIYPSDHTKLLFCEDYKDEDSFVQEYDENVNLAYESMMSGFDVFNRYCDDKQINLIIKNFLIENKDIADKGSFNAFILNSSYFKNLKSYDSDAYWFDLGIPIQNALNKIRIKNAKVDLLTYEIELEENTDEYGCVKIDKLSYKDNEYKKCILLLDNAYQALAFSDADTAYDEDKTFILPYMADSLKKTFEYVADLPFDLFQLAVHLYINGLKWDYDDGDKDERLAFKYVKAIYEKIESQYNSVLMLKKGIQSKFKEINNFVFYMIMQYKLNNYRIEKAKEIIGNLENIEYGDGGLYISEDDEKSNKNIEYFYKNKYKIDEIVKVDKLLNCKKLGIELLDLVEVDAEFNVVEEKDEFQYLFDKYEELKSVDYINRLSNENFKAENKYSIEDIDLMSGYEFEKFISRLFQKMGYKAYATQESNDQGVDVIAEKGDVKVAIQTKCYNGTVGNSAIQEIVAGMKYYEATKAMVITNSTFTKSAIELAKKNNVQLWDRKTLIEKINEVM